ncbi:MAG: lipopolysaccharide transport system ATP-binding protein [Puniceicoccaceae bacterium 5H]|nr:MAG: lipopolysaccharide transport system ATP-binding protein [Puniceicoccaceae bacterium 5H]
MAQDAPILAEHDQDAWRIRLRGVTKRYPIPESTQASQRQPIKRAFEWACRRAQGPIEAPEFTALRDIDLEVRPSECVGILGLNGSGKSTLLQIICGILDHSEGTVEVRGRIAALLELGSGFDPDFTGRENVFLNASILGLGKKQVQERFHEVEAFADIGTFIDQPVRTYSSGMLMRLAFAVQILVEPEILIVDEALAVGDAAFQRKCFSRIEQLRAKGMTILFVSHDQSAVLNLCDRAMLLYQGDSICSGNAKFVTAQYEKLLHAPHAQRSRLVEEIRVLTDYEDEPEAEDDGSNEAVSEVDPDLNSRSRLEYPSHGAYIRNPRLLDESGEEVNRLHRRGFYTLAYEVEFHRDCEHVAFAMLIKTKEGRELGGCRSHPNHQRIQHVSKGEIKRVRFRFQALLNHGVYFMNTGVEGYVDDSPSYLHRIVDVLAFQIIAEKGALPTSVVDFAFDPSVEDAALPIEVEVRAEA